MFKINAIEQYGRKEKIRSHGILEQQHNKEDDEESTIL